MTEFDCGCAIRTGAGDIVFCQLHAAAADLLSALQVPGGLGDYCFCRSVPRFPKEHTSECMEACAALRKAGGYY